jgi:peptidylprolyl isomerase
VETPPPEKIFKFMRWIVLLLLGYSFLHITMGTSKTPLVHPSQKTTGTATSAKDCNCPDNNPFSSFSALAIPFLPSTSLTAHIEDVITGKGEPLQCAQLATLRYSYATASGTQIFSNLTPGTSPETVRIGNGEMLPGLEQGILGMRSGGARTITIPPNLAFDPVTDIRILRNHEQFALKSTKEAVVAKASLLSLAPAAPSSSMPLRFINGPIGGGPPAQCGNIVYADITVWKLDGKQLFATTEGKPIAVTLGASSVPYGIEQGMLGMREGGVRTLIIPPAYMKPLDATQPQSINVALPTNEILLAIVALHSAPSK